MKLKIISALALLLLLAGHAQAENIITYTNLVVAGGQSMSMTITNGQLAKVVCAKFPQAQAKISVVVGNIIFTFTASDVSSSSIGEGTQGPPTVAGPATITLTSLNASYAAFSTVEVMSPPPPAPVVTPLTGVVIPADAGGPVNIILESSTDLVTWTPALPGTYGTSTTNRFFRVRATR